MEILTSFAVVLDDGKREMTAEDYKRYQTNMLLLRENMQRSTKFSCSGINAALRKHIGIPFQKTNENKAIPYHAPGMNFEKTIATSGNFPLTMQGILRFFNQKVPLDTLIQFAIEGDWISKDGGTYWRFIDAVCFRYGLKPLRISECAQIKDAMEDGGIVAALIKHDIFPEELENHLSVITGFDFSSVYMKSTSTKGLEVLPIDDFFENALVLWAITEE